MGKFGWHYPPGAANDPNAPYNESDHSHDHRWNGNKQSSPTLEDNAAIFRDYCEYAEGRRGEGWSCEEERNFRCEMKSVTKVRDDKPNIEYLASTEDSHNQFRYIETLFCKAMENVEWNKQDEVEYLHADPPGHGDGYVSVRVRDHIVKYEE